jgi:hypothetical protein
MPTPPDPHSDDSGRPDELASVHRLPHTPEQPDPAAVELYHRLQSQHGQLVERIGGYAGDAAAIARLTRTVATHHRTRAILAATARNVFGYPITGALLLTRRVWDARSGARYERMQARAEQAGDAKALLEWETRGKEAREQRHRHRVEWWSTMPLAWTRAFGLGAGCLAGVLLVVGLALSVMSRDAARILAPFTALFAFIADLVRIVTLVWASFLLAVVVAGWIVLWAVGRNRAADTGSVWDAQESSDSPAPAATRADATRRWTTSQPAITAPDEGLTYYTETGYEGHDPAETATVVDAPTEVEVTTYVPADVAPVPARQPRRRLLPRPGIDPDEETVIGSLQELGIAKLSVREGWPAEDLDPGDPEYARRGLWPMRPTRDGDGWRCQLRLPRGANVAMIVAKRDLLAHNLVRKPHEVWATEPDDKASVLDLWIADRGALNRPVPPWPLLTNLDTARTDYFRGVPLAIDVRGNVIPGRLFEANYVAGGIMGSGKSMLLIAAVAGGMLDPLVDIDVFVMAQNADFEPARPRLRTLQTGVGPDTVSACMDRIDWLYDSLTERGRALREHNERAVTRRLAEIDSRLRPQMLVIDECQALFLDEKHGEDAIKKLVKLQGAARKYALTIMYATPEPTGDSIPRRLVAVTSNNACFSIGDHIGNDAVLGTGSHKSGVTAVGLRRKVDDQHLGDVGTAMTRGFTLNPELLRFFYLNVDTLTRVTRRAMELYSGQGSTPSAGFRADVIEAMAGQEKVKSRDVLGRLGTRWPSVYSGWSAQELAKALRQQFGAQIRNGRVDGEAGQRYIALTDLTGDQDDDNAED